MLNAAMTQPESTPSADKREPAQGMDAETPGTALPRAASVRRLPTKPFARGNDLGRANRGRRPLNPVQRLQRECRRIYIDLRRGKIESHIANALLGCLKLEIELLDRYEIGERFAQYEQQIATLESRYQRLSSRMPQVGRAD